MTWQNRRELFRAHMQGEKCAHPGSVFDPISARIAEDLGFEVGMFAGIKQKQQLEAVAKVCRLPIILGGAGLDVIDLDYLGSMGVRLCLQSHQPVMAAIQATYNTLKALREGVKPSELGDIFDRDLISKFSREEMYGYWIQEFLE